VAEKIEDSIFHMQKLIKWKKRGERQQYSQNRNIYIYIYIYIYIKEAKNEKKIHHYIKLNGEITKKKTFIKG